MIISKKIILGFIIFTNIFLSQLILAKEIPYTLEDRDRLIRVEERMVTKEELKAEIGSVRSELKAEIGSVRSELKAEINNLRSEIKDFMLWGFGVTFAGVFALIGFVLWDRRTAIAPAVRKNKELEEREEKVEKALKEMALHDQNVSDALKHVGLL